MNLEEQVKLFSEQTPDKPAVICQGRTLSYSALWQAVREKAGSLKADGLTDGQPYVFMTTQDESFIVTYLAVHLCGAIAVPLEASTPVERQQQIRDELNGPNTLASFNGNEMVNGQRSMVNGKWSNDKCSDILYTTGTTGKAKGVMISARTWSANAENLIDRLGFTSEQLFIICGPLNHLGSLSKIYPTLMTGGTLYLMQSLKDLGAFFSVFELPFTKFATFLVPSSIRMLLQFAPNELAAVASKIDFIETGAAAISQSDMELLCQTLPHSRLFNTYASTETGIVCSYEFSKYGCVPGLLGKPMKHSSVRIDRDGRVICSGQTLMSGYAGAPELTAQVLINGEIHTSDIGTLDADGMLHLQGRQDDVINVGGYKVNPLEVEDAVSGFEPIADCICIPARHILLGTVPKLLYVPKQGKDVKPKDIADFLKGRLENYKIPLLYEVVDAIKRTYNGKLDRKAYK
ncbi:MAG: acyl--CoA ligase [Bacteroidaceae bacterium]|nr:acyl--CoA ligase [Bacteroidaceae bacterium]